jgi:hypothetical protein
MRSKSEDVGIREVVGGFEGVVRELEDVEAGLVAGRADYNKSRTKHDPASTP